jgi:UDP-N-acetylglucosamine acyltransferase
MKASVRIHPTAVVEDGVDLGDGVTIGPFSYLQTGVTVGDGTEIGPHVTLLEFSTLGEACHLHAGAVVGDLPQDIAFGGEESYVSIGDRCQIRECVTIHRGTVPGSSTVVGNDCMLMACSHLGHNVQLGNEVILANGVLLAGHAQVGDQVFMGGNAMVHQFARVGRLAMISGATAAKKDVPPFCMTRAHTAGVMGLNNVGLRRAGVASKDRLELKRALKLLYRSGLNVSQALERIDAETDGDLVAEFAAFVRASERGICSWAAVEPGA